MGKPMPKISRLKLTPFYFMETNYLPIGLKVNPQNIKLINVLKRLEDYDFSSITQSCMQKYSWEKDYAIKIEVWTKQFFSLAFLDNGYYHIPENDVVNIGIE
ncbi:hypothetical protein [Chryseobacterium caseinilyticum]|uniref:Uncharacterized protein n=1 Tax=Chryseobacterium caseinilyticum TaxID=2771428 RepID=A0ABR8ZIU0_9FLAO|nr:hypothetical protein [Chryseobacterium caseinilyticum]MBD8084656.1 hypothetical protein [Chryseobacterium caseinilyticum]